MNKLKSRTDSQRSSNLQQNHPFRLCFSLQFTDHAIIKDQPLPPSSFLSLSLPLPPPISSDVKVHTLPHPKPSLQLCFGPNIVGRRTICVPPKKTTTSCIKRIKSSRGVTKAKGWQSHRQAQTLVTSFPFRDITEAASVFTPSRKAHAGEAERMEGSFHCGCVQESHCCTQLNTTAPRSEESGNRCFFSCF